MAVGFPEVVQYYPLDHEYLGYAIENFETWVDGRKHEVRRVPELTQPYVPVDGEPYSQLRWHVKDVEFPHGRRTVVRVRYDASYQPRDMEGGEANYIFGTGRSWSGTIGRAFAIRGAQDRIRLKASLRRDQRRPFFETAEKTSERPSTTRAKSLSANGFEM